jgi:hypothetical protein
MAIFQVHIFINETAIRSRRGPFQIISENSPAVNILVTIHAEIFPVAPIQWIVVMVAILMVNGQQVPF